MALVSKTSCKVSGALGFILRISWLVGIAPLHFTKIHKSWRVRVSRPSSFYGILLIGSLSILAIGARLANMFISKDKTMYATTSTAIFHIVDRLIVIVPVATASITGISRMTLMIDNINQIQEINDEINFYDPTVISQRRNWIPVFIAATGIFVTYCNYFPYIQVAIREQKDVILSSTVFFYVTLCNIHYILEVLIAIIIMTVVSTFKKLNRTFENLLNKEQNGGVTQYKAIYKATLHLATLHNRLTYDVVRQVDQAHGFLLVNLLVSCTVDLIVTFYYVTHELLNNVGLPGLFRIFWCIFHTTRILIIIEPCHQTQEQINFSKKLLKRMKQAIGMNDIDILKGLRYVDLIPAHFAPLNMIHLNRRLIVTIVSTITMYLAIVVKY